MLFGKVNKYIGIAGVILLLAGCSGMGGDEDILPMKNGDYFKYERMSSSKVKQTTVIKLVKQPDENWRYTETLITEHVERTSVRDERVTDDYELAASGRIIGYTDSDKKFNELGKIQTKDRLVKIWLPPAKRKVGAKVHFSGFPNVMRITKKMEWKRWTVWVAEYGGHRYYFEVDTGFRVGNDWSSQEWTLVEFTAPGLY